MNSTLIQGYIFLYAVYGGIIIGAVYDLLSLIRRICHEKKWINALLDLFFCLFAAFIILAILYRAASGQIRIFSLLGFALGFGLYTWGFKRLIRGIGRRIFHKPKEKQETKQEKPKK